MSQPTNPSEQSQPTTVSAVTQTTDSDFATITPAEAEVYVRSGPATTSPRLGILKAGEKAAALGKTRAGDWILIEFSQAPDGKAWVNAALVNLSKGDLPIVDSSVP